jgi:hypothetical protein
MITSVARPTNRPQVALTPLYYRLLYDDLAFFMSQLWGPDGKRFSVAKHHRDWCQRFTQARRLVLLAPRDHGKSSLALVYVAWRFWRHGCAPATGLPADKGRETFSAVLFSATHTQARLLLNTFRDLLVANTWLFGELGPDQSAAGRRRRITWSASEVRLPTGASLRSRAFRTSVRGLHPDLLLCDDVLSDANSATSAQRDATWRFFVGTLVPMNPGQLIVLGTAFHHDDLLHRLRPTAASDAASDGAHQDPDAGFSFDWVKYPALDPETETALWPARYPTEVLLARRAFDPTSFSREFQNEPRDDAASLFPHELTQRALNAGAGLSFAPAYGRSSSELVLLGADLAVSGAPRADFTVVLVAAFNHVTGRRRLLAAHRLKGLDLDGQVELICGLCTAHGVDLGIIEDNGFQRWLVDELRKRPETRGRIFGHTTGAHRGDLRDIMMQLRFALLGGQWVIPSGDQETRHFAHIWQAELAAYGWRDGRLEGVGEHDDTVLATAFIEVGVRLTEYTAARLPREELVYATDLGFEPRRITPELDVLDKELGFESIHDAWLRRNRDELD